MIRFLNPSEIHRFHLVLAGLLFLGIPAESQQSSVYGRFEADYATGCSPLKVILTETDTFPPETVRQYDFDGDGTFVGFEPAEAITYTYDQPGTYSIVQVINRDITPKTDTIHVQVYDATIPEFSVLTCESNGVTVTIDPGTYDQYRILYTATDSVTVDRGQQAAPYFYSAGTYTIRVKGLYNEGKNNCGLDSHTFTTIKDLIPADLQEIYLTRKDNTNGRIDLKYQLSLNVVYHLERAEDFPAGFSEYALLPANSKTFTMNGINTNDRVNIFRIAAFDACQQKYVYSDTAGSLILNAEAENNRNRLSWVGYSPDFEQYAIFRDGQEIGNISTETPAIYLDDDVTCFSTYCYNMVETGENGVKSYSDTTCVESFKIYFPPPVRNTTASVGEAGIELAWTPPPDIESTGYFIQRYISEDVYATIDTVDNMQYTDTGPDRDPISYCYRISYLDECRNRSNLGDLACTIGLSIDDNLTLTWNKYTGWENGVAGYVLESYSEQGALLDEIEMGHALSWSITEPLARQFLRFRVRASSNDSPPLKAYSNYITKEIESVLWVPNAFTPNGDGLNDTFHAEGTLMKEYKMEIFSRYGELIYNTQDQLSGWDGTWDGKDVPFSTYIYKLDATDEKGKHYELSGKVVLIR